MKHKEALTSEEGKYPSGVRSLPLPKPVCFAALLNDDGSKFKAQIWPIQQTPQCQPHCSWGRETMQHQQSSAQKHGTHRQSRDKQSTPRNTVPVSLFALQATWLMGHSVVTDRGARKPFAFVCVYIYSHFVIVYGLFV